MTQYTWFFIFNRVEFEALGLVSKNYALNLEGIGSKNILVTKASTIAMTYDGIFLPIELNDQNPFAIDERAVYVDDDDNVWLGIEIEN